MFFPPFGEQKILLLTLDSHDFKHVVKKTTIHKFGFPRKELKWEVGNKVKIRMGGGKRNDTQNLFCLFFVSCLSLWLSSMASLLSDPSSNWRIGRNGETGKRSNGPCL